MVAPASVPNARSSHPSARTPVAEARLATEIATLDELDDAGIRARWTELYDGPAPKFMRRPLMQRFVAHGLQVAAFGGLPQSVLKRLASLAETERLGGFSDLPGTPVVKPGTRLVRVFGGKTHTVTVEDDGFIWNGEPYRSLSAIAREITGIRWNGWAFFGLKRRSMRNKNAAKTADAKVGTSRSASSGSALPSALNEGTGNG